MARSATVDGDYFAAGPSVEISGTVNGDVYVFAAEVIIDGRVNGDVLAAAGTINFSGTAQDVRVAGGNLTITGSIGRNLTATGGNIELAPSAVVQGSAVIAGGNVNLSAPIGKGLKIAARSATLADRVGGNVEATAGRLRIASRAEIQGNVIYSSGQEASVSEGARISGQIKRVSTPIGPPGARIWEAVFFGWLLWVATNFISTLILGLLSLRFLPAYHQTVVAVIRRKPWNSVGIGFLAIVVTPVVCALLFALVMTIPLAFIITAAYLMLVYFARIFVMSWIGEAILTRFQAVPNRAWAFVLGLFIYYLVALIPVMGWLAVLVTVLFGLGAEVMARRDFYSSARRQQLL